jgi:ORF6N domain
MADKSEIILVDQIEPLIHAIRGESMILDSDLALLYGVPTGTLNRQVKRNKGRFPGDFCFQLTREEFENLRCQTGISSSYGGRRYLPYVFTEHGAIMAASVLSSPRAVEVSVFVVRAFVKLRAFALSHKELAQKLNELDKKVGSHDDAIRQVIAAIRQLMTPPAEPKPKRRIGFNRREE